jgi:hypothetical protein
MANTIIILCDRERAEMLLQAAKHFCPDAVPATSGQVYVRIKGSDDDRGEKTARTITRRRPAGASG